MPIFQYQAIDLKGRQKTGTIDADTARDAREKLRRQEVRVTLMEKVTAAQKESGARKKYFRLERKVNVRELAILTRQFSTLLGAGVHLSEALNVLIDQVGDRKLEMVFRDIREKIMAVANS